MQRPGADASLLEFAGHLVCAMLGAGKEQHHIEAGIAQQMQQQIHLQIVSHFVKQLCHRRCRIGAPANLRVGAMTRTRMPRRGEGWATSRVRIGSVNAAVLPVPVWAMPMTSWPASTCGMAAV